MDKKAYFLYYPEDDLEEYPTEKELMVRIEELLNCGEQEVEDLQVVVGQKYTVLQSFKLKSS